MRLVVSRPNAWHLFILLLMIALGSEYWDKDPVLLAGGFQLPWPRFILALAVLPLLVAPSDWRWTVLLKVPTPLAPMLVFWACCGLSFVGLMVAPGRADPLQFVKTFVHLTAYILFVYVVVRWITWARLFVLVRVYYWLGIAAAVLALLQFAHGTFGLVAFLDRFTFQSAEYDVGKGLSVGFRTASFFGEPSWAARYYVHFIALALAYWWHTRKRHHLYALTMFVAAFYTANSLLGYVILGTFVLAASIAQMWRHNTFSLSARKKIVLVASAYVFLILWLIGVTPPVPDLIDRSVARVSLIMKGAGAAGNRIDSVFAGLEVWKLAPAFGVGLGNIAAYIVDFYTDPEWVLRSRHASDSLYVQLLAETGLVGLAGFLWFWGRLLWFSAPRGFESQNNELVAQSYGWLRFLQLDLLAQAVGLVNSSDYLNPHLWTVIAIVLACKTMLLRSASAWEHAR